MRIIKLRKNNHEYYYLKHSFRFQGKVITREKYLGKKIPENIKEIEQAFLEECKKKSIFRLFEKIKQGFRREWKKYPDSIKEKLKEQITIAFTYNTNAIEGSTISLDETRELAEHRISPNKPLKDVKETEAHLQLFLEMLEKKERLSLNLILKWHKKLFKETKPDIAGRIRDYNVKVGFYKAPDWQDLKKLLRKMILFYNENKRMNPVELAARTHYKFEKIHPFGDGNGRIGRIIMNHILWHNKYPILIIEYKKRKAYYKALQKDEDKFFAYFARRYLKTYERYVKK
ncbi:MAG TPA: Fic family protein [Candidatus Woesearchaeota archaeon]|nr:Fic family protein [Candidatus Woesearchaeota archaeon]